MKYRYANVDEFVIFENGMCVGFVSGSMTAAVTAARAVAESGSRVEIENEWGYRNEVESYVALLEAHTAMRFPRKDT